MHWACIHFVYLLTCCSTLGRALISERGRSGGCTRTELTWKWVSFDSHAIHVLPSCTSLGSLYPVVSLSMPPHMVVPVLTHNVPLNKDSYLPVHYTTKWLISIHWQVCSLTPNDSTVFPEYDWLIGNHSDELTPWIPVMASRSSFTTRYFVLPCCAHDFNKKVLGWWLVTWEEGLHVWGSKQVLTRPCPSLKQFSLCTMR